MLHKNTCPFSMYETDKTEQMIFNHKLYYNAPFPQQNTQFVHTLVAF